MNDFMTPSEYAGSPEALAAQQQLQQQQRAAEQSNFDGSSLVDFAQPGVEIASAVLSQSITQNDLLDNATEVDLVSDFDEQLGEAAGENIVGNILEAAGNGAGAVGEVIGDVVGGIADFLGSLS